MPSYDHICTNTECNNEWEDQYSIKQDPPKICPKCNQQTAKRLISGGSGRGIVELSGNDLKDKVKSDAAKLKRDMHNSTSMYANLLGENKYQELQTKIDKNKR